MRLWPIASTTIARSLQLVTWSLRAVRMWVRCLIQPTPTPKCPRSWPVSPCSGRHLGSRRWRPRAFPHFTMMLALSSRTPLAVQVFKPTPSFQDLPFKLVPLPSRLPLRVARWVINMFFLASVGQLLPPSPAFVVMDSIALRALFYMDSICPACVVSHLETPTRLKVW